MSRLVVLPGGGGHVAQVRPNARQQARTAGHPSIYDHQAERPDAHGMVLIPETVARYCMAHLDADRSPAFPTAHDDARRELHGQLDRVRTFVESDPTPAHGTGRPS